MVAVTRTRYRGFTLIEILITLAIVGVLAAVALPSYSNFITKSEIRTAQADLLALSLNLENQYQRTLAYPVLDASDDPVGTFTGWTPASEVFEFSVVSTTGTYTLTAKGATGSKLAGCELEIDHENARKAPGCPHTSGNWL